MKDAILVRGARQHNLKGFDLEIPRRAFTVITGPSGSGKSSLAFDTIYAEGQRRYVESLSAYARQFLERMEKPDVDSIDGLSPAVAIEQKNPTKTSRSTVGTATEIYDYLRLLWARVGHTFCPLCGREMRPDTVQSVVRHGAGAAGRGPASTSPSRSCCRRRSRTRSWSRTCARRASCASSVDGAIKHLDELMTRRGRRHASRRNCSSSSTAWSSATRRAGVSPTPSAPRFARATATASSCSRSRFDAARRRGRRRGCASPSATSAPTTARAPRRRRRSSSRSTARAAPASAATDSARRSSTTKR